LWQHQKAEHKNGPLQLHLKRYNLSVCVLALAIPFLPPTESRMLQGAAGRCAMEQALPHAGKVLDAAVKGCLFSRHGASEDPL